MRYVIEGKVTRLALHGINVTMSIMPHRDGKLSDKLSEQSDLVIPADYAPNIGAPITITVEA